MADAEAQNTEIVEKTWEDDLPGRMRLFVLMYCTDEECFMNGTRAYKAAYAKRNKASGLLEEPSDETAAVNASKLLRKAKVKASIRMLLRLTREESDEEAVYRVVKLYETMATYDPADIIDVNGRLRVKDLHELGPLSRCITGIEEKVYKEGSAYVVKLADRGSYMRYLAKYLNLIRPDTTNLINIPFIMSYGKAEAERFNGESEGSTNADSESNPANCSE